MAEDEALTVEDALDAPWAMLEHNGEGGTAQTRRKFRELLEDLGAADRRVKEDYEGRYPIELLQNAHDACHDGGIEGTAWFLLTDSALLVANEGTPFDADRIVSLTRLGATSKGAATTQRHLIGYKGVGFSSVFSITDRPQVSSSGALFGFDADRALDLVTSALGKAPKRLSSRAFPFRLDASDFGEDWAAVTAMHAAGAATVIRLPLREAGSREAVADLLRQALAPQALLFMPSLDTIVLTIGVEEHRWTRRDGEVLGVGKVIHLEAGNRQESWLLATGTVAAPEQVRLVDDEIWHGVEQLNIAAALPWRDGKIDPSRGPQRIHVYFPTDDQLGRSVIVHGDFFLHSSRRFIQSLGTAGQITRAVALGAVGLVVSLAESVAELGPELLQALALSDNTSGYGDSLTQLLDSALAEAKIVRTAGSGDPKRAKDLRVLRTSLDPHEHVSVLRSLREPQDLVHFDDDIAYASPWLEHLGARPLSSSEIAKRISPSKIRGGYEASLELLYSWWRNVPRVEEAAVRNALRENAVIQDDQHKWRVPAEVYRYERDVPAPPRPLRPARLRPLTQYHLAQFATTTLGVRSLSAEALLEHVLDIVEDGGYGKRADEARRLLAFLSGLFASHREAFDPDDERLRTIRVPVTAVSGSAIEWREAGVTYMPSSLSGDDTAEILYGPFGLAEFVSAEHVRLGADARGLLATLGIAAAPRVIEYEIVNPTAGTTNTPEKAWLADERVEVPSCPRGHWNIPRVYAITTLDRLYELLTSKDRHRLAVLADRLSQLEDPFGGSDTVRCQRQCTASRQAIIGFRHWAMLTQQWIPVTDAGRRTFTYPAGAWFGAPPAVMAVLPTTSLDEAVAGPLGCIDFERPPRGGIEAALMRLARKSPDLGSASPDLLVAADELLSKLDVVADSATSRTCPPLPAMRGTEPEWSRSPLVPDLPGLELLGSVVRLPAGSALWRGLQRAYGVRLASSVVERRVQVEVAEGTAPLLTERTKAEVLALMLATRSGAQRVLARRLGRLSDEPVYEIYLDLIHGDEQATTAPLAHHLEVGDLDDEGEATSAILFSDVSGERASFPWCRTLAEFLVPGTDRVMTLLHSYFHARDDVLAEYRVSEDRIEQAAEALRRWPFEADAIRHVVRSLDELVPASGEDLPWDEHEALQVEDDEATVPAGDDGSDRESTPPEQSLPGEPLATVTEDADWDIPWDAEPGADGGSSETFGGRIRRRSADPASGAGSSRSGGSGQSWLQFDGPIELEFGDDPGAGASRRGASGMGGTPAPRLPSDGSAGEMMPNKDVEERAIEVATSLGNRLGAEVIRVDRQNLGWDLEFHFSDSVWWPVEVKGMADENEAFVLTRNELRAAIEQPEYRLLFVTGTRWLEGRVVLIRARDAGISNADMETLSWTVSRWRSYPMEHSEAWRTRSSSEATP